MRTCMLWWAGFVLHEPLVLERFTQVMNALRAEHAVDLYRYKGVVCVREATGSLRRAVLQGVHVPWQVSRDDGSLDH